MPGRRSVMAQILRERRRLLEEMTQLYEVHEEILIRLRRLEDLIKAEEQRGPRSYLDHIVERTGSKGADS